MKGVIPMAFEMTNVPPPTTPRVSLTFSGLMILKPGTAARTCEIGVQKFERDHLFQVMLILNRPNRPPVGAAVFTGPLVTPFTIRRAVNPPAAPDFKVYEVTRFDRTVPVPATTPPPFDHRWALNLALKHPRVDINEDTKPVITLNTGVLYTPSLTSSTFSPRFERNGTPDDRLNQFAPSLAVSIEPEGRIIFEGVDSGLPLHLELPRAEDPPDMTYTLAFVNEPPSFALPPHDEFAFYYRMIQVDGSEIREGDRFRLRFGPQVRLDEIPCMPTTKNP